MVSTMVLESILKSRFALKHPASMALFAIVVTVISVGISIFTFPDSASVLFVALITIASIPILTRILTSEETHESHRPGNPATFFGRHFHLISVYAYFFLGLILANAFLYAELPAAVQEKVFFEQNNTTRQIEALRGKATEGQFAPLQAQESPSNPCSSHSFFPLAIDCIFKNNAIVLGWTLLFSLLYGAGAIFLIGWNASVIGTVIGKEILTSNHASAWSKALGLIPHGLPEIVAYFIGAIAGGMISVAIAKKAYEKNEFQTIAKDVLAMVIIAYVLLLGAAVIEALVILS